MLKGKKILYCKKAFSIVELMVTALIFSIILAAAFLLLSSGRNVWWVGDIHLAVQQELRKAKDLLVKDLTQARLATFTITGGSSVNCDIPLAIADGGAVSWQQVSYFLDGASNDQLIRTSSTPTGTVLVSKVVANNINNITFAPDATNARLINVSITASKQNIIGRTFTYTLTLMIGIKN